MADSLPTIAPRAEQRQRGSAVAPATSRLKLLFMAPYAVVPPRYGGPLRVYNLCRELGREFQVVQFAQQTQRSNAGLGVAPVRRQVTASYRELSSRNLVSLLLYAATSLRFECPPIWQSRMLALAAPAWLRATLQSADMVHVEHPWQYAWAYRAVNGRVPITLGAQNVEAALYPAERIKAPAAVARRIAEIIARQESRAVTGASHVFAASLEDVHELARRYGRPEARCTVIPNGVDTLWYRPVDQATRERRKHELGLPAARPLVIFAGSQHPPNVEAARRLLELASTWGDDPVHFAVVGTVGRALAAGGNRNVTVTGAVEQTRPYFEAADIALNPMLAGSGTNLKQLEYMAMGLPTIATPTGARGIPIVDGTSGLLRAADDFAGALRGLLAQPQQQRAIGSAGRELVEQQFSWQSIGALLRAALHDLHTSHP